MTEQRKGYENFVYQNGVYDLGTKGDMRRNERNLMWNLDPYIQTHWQLTSALGLDAGARYSSTYRKLKNQSIPLSTPYAT